MKDLNLDTVRPEAQQWLQSRLPKAGEVVGPLVPRSPEVRQLFDEVGGRWFSLLFFLGSIKLVDVS